MAKFLFVYHGGRKAKSSEEYDEAKQAFASWLTDLGDAIIDGGYPVYSKKTVTSDRSVEPNAGANPAIGYSIVDALNMEDVIGIAKRCPILDYDGEVEICEVREEF